MSNQKKSKSQVAQFAAYQAENRQEKNKIRKLKRHVNANPEDHQAWDGLERLKKDGKVYARTINASRHRATAEEKASRELDAQVKRACSTGFIENRNVKEKRGNTMIKTAFAIIGIDSGRVFKTMQASISQG